MRSAIQRMAPLLAVLAMARPTFAATPTPGMTPPPTPGISPTAHPSLATSVPSSPTFAPSPSRTARRWTPVPSPSPETVADDDATPGEIPDAPEDEAFVHATPSPQPLPTEAPIGQVRAFRTAGRDAPPAFVAPSIELPPGADDAEDGAPATAMPPLDQPYIATVTFRAMASTEVDGFDLVIIYPRSAGDFVGSRNGVECTKTGDGTMFADDHDDGMLRLLVESNRALTFPYDIVCRFTVEPNATLPARVIAVNVEQVTSGDAGAEPSALTVTVLAH